MAKRAQPTHSMLRIQGPGQATRVEDLLRDQYFIGRGDASGELHVDFAVPGDAHLSRQHCRIFRKDDAYWIQNLGANGTYVGGKLIEEPVALKNKAKVEIGNDTKLEFLELTHAERAKELQIGDEAQAEEVEAGVTPGERKKKSILQSKWMWGVLGFYGVIVLLVLAAAGADEKAATDPGEGPYFRSLLSERIEDVEVPEDARTVAQRMWAEALEDHGDDQLDRGPHAYYLVQRARRCLALLGYKTIDSAMAQNEEIALKASTVLEKLETRLQADYVLAKRLLASRQYAAAREVYERIRDAVPDRYAPIQKFAAQRAYALRNWR